MATPLSGRYASIRVGGSTAGSDLGETIECLGHWEISIAGDELDASCFGTVWKKNMAGMKGWTGTIEGFFNPSTAADTQITSLMDAALTATKLNDIRFYLQTSSGLFFMPLYTATDTPPGVESASTEFGAYISNIRITHDKNGLAGAAYNVTGYGALGLYQGDISIIASTD